ARICPGTKRPPPIGPELVGSLAEGWLGGLEEEAPWARAEGVAMVSPSAKAVSAPKSVAASPPTGEPHDPQNRTPEAIGFPHEVQNIRRESYHRPRFTAKL